MVQSISSWSTSLWVFEPVRPQVISTGWKSSQP